MLGSETLRNSQSSVALRNNTTMADENSDASLKGVVSPAEGRRKKPSAVQAYTS